MFTKMPFVNEKMQDWIKNKNMKNLSIKDHLIITVYRLFLKLSWILHEKLNIRIRGIGVASDWVKSEFNFMFRNCQFRFLPAAARSYGLLPAGIPNEPETHRFLDSVLAHSIDPVVFVDIGASIGEFVITMASKEKVAKVYAFEPHPKTFVALAASARGFGKKIDLHEAAVGDEKGELLFPIAEGSPTGAGFGGAHGEASVSVAVCRLDDTLDFPDDVPVIMLIDIEGGELSAIQSGAKFIGDRQPLIVFEYNLVSRRFFTLEQIRECLKDYDFFRLQSCTGKLDLNLEDTWNVVAIPGNDYWADLRNNRSLFADNE